MLNFTFLRTLRSTVHKEEVYAHKWLELSQSSFDFLGSENRGNWLPDYIVK